MAAKTKTASKATTKTTKKAANAKKTAETAVEDAVETATTQFEAVASKAQEQYFSLVEQGQSLALDGIETVVDTMAKVQIPAIPGLSSTPRELPVISIPTDMVDTYFEFANKVLANQREFANKALALTAKK